MKGIALFNIPFSGNLTADPELVTNTESGVARLNFRLGVNEGQRGSDNEKTHFLNFTAFAETAENAAKSFKKGDRVQVLARVNTYPKTVYLPVKGSDELVEKEITLVGFTATDIAAPVRFATVEIHKTARKSSDSGSEGAPAPAAKRAPAPRTAPAKAAVAAAPRTTTSKPSPAKTPSSLSPGRAGFLVSRDVYACFPLTARPAQEATVTTTPLTPDAATDLISSLAGTLTGAVTANPVLFAVIAGFIVMVSSAGRRQEQEGTDRPVAAVLGRPAQRGLRPGRGRCEMEGFLFRRCRTAAHHGDHHFRGHAEDLRRWRTSSPHAHGTTRPKAPGYPTLGQTVRMEARRRKYFPRGVAVKAGERFAHR